MRWSALLLLSAVLVLACTATPEGGPYTREEVRRSFSEIFRANTLPEREDIARWWGLSVWTVSYVEDEDVYEITVPNPWGDGDREIWAIDMSTSVIWPVDTGALLTAIGLHCRGRNDPSEECQTYSRAIDDLKELLFESPTPPLRLESTPIPKGLPPPAFVSIGFCVNTPPVIIEREWQVSAPRGVPGPVRPDEIVQLGLRNKFGEGDERYWVLVRVIAPDGTSTATSRALVGSEWVYILYPRDFIGATSVYPGTYTMVWETEGGFIACDGFIVESY